MERAQKMVIVPEETLETSATTKELNNPHSASDDVASSVWTDLSEQLLQERRKNSIQTPGNNLSRLDTELSGILRSKNYSTDRAKWNEFLPVLQKYLFFKQNKNKPSILSKDNEGDDNSEDNDDGNNKDLMSSKIISKVPQTYKKPARKLLEHLSKQTDNRISWNNDGNVTIDGDLIGNSNITDFINVAMRKRRHDDSIVGLETFSKFLQSIQIPPGLVKNSVLLSNKKSKTDSTNVEDVDTNDDDEDDDNDEFKTPGKFLDKTLTPKGQSTPLKKAGDAFRRRALFNSQTGSGGWLTFNF